jgi:hypothetical protein
MPGADDDDVIEPHSATPPPAGPGVAHPAPVLNIAWATVRQYKKTVKYYSLCKLRARQMRSGVAGISM